MKKLKTSYTIFLVSTLIISIIAVPTIYNFYSKDNFDQNSVVLTGEWYIEGTATDFRLTNSDYLNINLKSTELIPLYFESTPNIVSIITKKNELFTSTHFSLTGFKENSDYYLYEDGNLLACYKSDSNGEISFEHFLTEEHHVFILEDESTIYIEPNGNVNPSYAPIRREGENTYVLLSDISEPIYIRRSHIELDGNGHSLRAPSGGYGLYLYDLDGVKIKNFEIRYGSSGIFLVHCRNCKILKNTISDCQYAAIRFVSGGVNNEIYENTLFNCRLGIDIQGAANTWIYHNNFEQFTYPNSYSAPGNFWFNPELLEGNFWLSYTGVDNGAGSGKHSIAGDGIGDTNIPWPLFAHFDEYPFINQNGWVNLPPIADIGGPYYNPESTTTNFDGSGSFDYNNDELEYRWDFNNDGMWDTDWRISPIASYTWNDDYVGTVALEVSDGELTNTDTTSVTISNVVPSVEIIPNIVLNQGDSFHFIPTVTDPGSDTFTYAWDFENDGSIDSTEEDPTHIYSELGSFHCRVIVSDDDGGIAEDYATVIVEEVQSERCVEGFARIIYNEVKYHGDALLYLTETSIQIEVDGQVFIWTVEEISICPNMDYYCASNQYSNITLILYKSYQPPAVLIIEDNIFFEGEETEIIDIIC